MAMASIGPFARFAIVQMPVVVCFGEVLLRLATRTGDAFAAGVLSGWLDGLNLAGMAPRGAALGALRHAQRGDMLRIARAGADCFAGGLDLSR